MKNFIKHGLSYFKKKVKEVMFYSSKKFRRFAHDTRKKVILLDSPEHSNLGDHAIIIAEREFVSQLAPEYNIYEFTHLECKQYEKIFHYIKYEDVVLLPGGGFIGSLWSNEHSLIIKILKRLKLNKIIIFPQTIYFYDNDTDAINEFVDTVNLCSNLTMFVRDKASYDLLKNLKVECRYELVPDIVLSLNRKIESHKNGKVLVCFRSDKEKVSDTNTILRLLASLNLEYDLTDMIVSDLKCYDKRYQLLNQKLEQFSQYDLLITDRLHAMILSTIVGTPCIAFDNLSKKVSGVYEWIKDLKYIRCISKDDVNNTIIKMMMSFSDSRYDYKLLEDSFQKIKECFIEKIN